MIVHDYEKDERPTFRKFMEILSFIVGAEDKLKHGHLPRIESDSFFDKYPNLRPEIIKVLTNEDMMRPFAELDYWDEEDFSPEQKAFMLACGAFDELSFYEYHFLTWADQTQH